MHYFQQQNKAFQARSHLTHSKVTWKGTFHALSAPLPTADLFHPLDECSNTP